MQFYGKHHFVVSYSESALHKIFLKYNCSFLKYITLLLEPLKNMSSFEMK